MAICIRKPTGRCETVLTGSMRRLAMPSRARVDQMWTRDRESADALMAATLLPAELGGGPART
jgi:hypothetical protein